MNYKCGDRVVCIDVPEGCRALEVGKVYTVRFQDKDAFLYLEEERIGGWYPYRFKPYNISFRERIECKRMFRLRTD